MYVLVEETTRHCCERVHRCQCRTSRHGFHDIGDENDISLLRLTDELQYLDRTEDVEHVKHAKENDAIRQWRARVVTYNTLAFRAVMLPCGRCAY
jgi:hypothetical protein